MFRDPKFYLFFTSIANAPAPRKSSGNVEGARGESRQPIAAAAFLRQVKAIKAWRKQARQD
jgi:hypothetical protein